jgi:tetratricopeptide (TPR) repeat protein
MSAIRTLLPLVIVAALAAPSTVFAQAGRYKRKSVGVKVKATEKTAKLEARKPEGEKKQEIPEITADQFMQIETKVQTIRDEQIREYIALIKETDADDPERPDLLFRLAELYAQKQRHLRFQGMEFYAKIAKVKAKAQKKTLQRKQQKFFQAEKKWLVASIKIYKQIADNKKFKDYPRMDEALFYYAFTLQSAKYAQQARAVFHRLIKDYPDSRYIPDAYLSFADYYFEQNQLAYAEKFYDKVLLFPKSGVYPYAMYKKGWVYLNLDRNQDALETFFKVVQITRKNKRARTINKAAKKDFVRAYAEVGKPQLAFKAFERVDKKYAFTMLEILGELYLDKGKAEKTIYVFHELMAQEPKNKKVCDWQYTVTRAMLTIGNPAQQVKEIERLVDLYSVVRDKNILPETELLECQENAQATTGELAKIWHQEAEKTLNTETLQYVDSLYKKYMGAFPDAEDYGEMQFYYGELLWRRAESEKNPRLATERWEQAAIQFTDVVKGGKVDKKLTQEAAYAAVLGWKNALAVDPRTKAPPVPKEDDADQKIPEPEEIPERELKMVTAFDVYIEYIKDPKDEELVMMKFLKARTFWRYKHYDKAIPLFEDIVKNNLDTEPGEWSVNLLLDAFNRSKKYDEMLKWVDILLTKKSFLEDKDELAERLDMLKAQSMRKAAEQLETDGKFVECGERYREIFNRNPKADGMPEVLYNAGVCYEKGKSIGLAIAMREELIKRFPKDNLAKKALVLIGNNYGAIAYYPDAASKFEEYSKKFGGEKDAANALANAVFYRKGIGQDDKAIKDIEDFVKAYGKKKQHVKEAAAALFGMTGIYEKTGNDDKVLKHLARYLKTFGKKGGVDWEIAAHVKMGEILWKRSCPVKGVDGACISIKRTRASRVKRSKRRKGNQLPTQCGPESKIKLTVADRKRKYVKDAQKHFATAVRLYGGGKAIGKVPGKDDAEKAGRVAAMTYWVAAAEFYLAEEDYEAFLRIDFPDKLNFDPKKEKVKKDSEKRLLKWKEAKEKALVKTSKGYTDILNFKQGGESWAIAGAARVGQLFQNYSDALFTAEIPKNVRTGPYAEDGVDAYCDALMELANPLEEKSVGAFAFCLDESTKRNWFNQWSRLCEKELGQIRPLDFPSASELHAAPNAMGSVIDRPNVIEAMRK